MAEDSRDSQERQWKYKKTPGFADIAGQLFEMKLSALIFTRCLLTFPRVDLAVNLGLAKPLDDIVFKVGNTPIFMQLKHFKDKQFYSTFLTQPKSDFNLVKCYKAYCSVKKTWKKKENEQLQKIYPFEDAIFVLYTNAKCSYGVISSVDDNGWQTILNTAGIYVCFSKETHSTIYEMFENLSVIHNLLNSGPVDSNCSNTPEVVQMINAMSIQEKKHLSEIIAELDNMGELSNYEEFLSKVWVFTNQASEQHLDSLIQQELGKLLGASDDHLANCFSIFFEKVQKWWRCPKGYGLTENSAFWKQITNYCVCRHVVSRVKELDSIPLKFSETELLSFRNILFPQDASTLKIVSGSTAILSALKIHQCLGKEMHLLIDVSKLYENQQEVCVLWRRWCNVLVLIMTNDEDDDWKIDPFLEILAANPGKMLILLGHMSGQKSRSSTYHMINDEFNMKQLDCKSFAYVQGLTVNLQGHNVAVKDIMDTEHLSGEILMQLLSKEKITLGSCLEQIIDYFIPRTLKHRNVVDNKIFFNNTYDYFIVGNTTELQKFVPEGKTVCIYGQDSINNKCQFIQVDEDFTESDFDKLCTENSNENFHWLNIEANDKVVWKKSKSSTAFITQYLQDDTHYNSFSDIEDFLTITVAEPGMGKTVLFSSIALQMKKQKPSTWVINVILNNHTDYLNHMNSTVIGLLEMSAGIKNPLEEEIFHNCLHFTNNVVVLLDGFDEISPGNSDKVLRFVKDLISETKVKHIWISSRPTMKQMLQNKLSSIAFELVPFSREEQKKFLEKYWNVHDVESFIEKLLDITAMNMKDQLGTFTGIPLQLRMLGDVFREDMQHYRDTGSINLPNTLDLLKLYSMFVDTKWEIYFRDKTKAVMSNEAQKMIGKKLRAMFRDQHEACALSTLLTEEEFSLLPSAKAVNRSINEFIEEFKSGEEKTGIIIDFVNGQLVFIHRTFQEYFAAVWLAEKFKEATCILEDKIADDKFKTTMTFFDRMLAQDCHLHIAVMNGDLKLLEDLLKEDQHLISSTDKGGRTALHASVIACSRKVNEEVSYKILHVLLNAGADLNKQDEVFLWRSLRYADALGAWKVVGILLQNGADSVDLISANSISDKCEIEVPLTIAVREGFTEFLEFFVSKGINIEEKFVYVHVYFSSYDLNVKVTLLQASSFWGHYDIVNMLLKRGAIVDACSHFQLTALMCAAMGGHLEIMNLLLHYGANHNAQSSMFQRSYSKSPPWGLTCNLRSNPFLNLMFEDAEDVEGCTVLHLAVLFCQKEAVEMLLKYGSHIDVVDGFGCTALHLAAEVGSLEIAELLLKNGACINATNRWRQTPLHVAVTHLNEEMVEYLISKNADTNKTDIDGRTYLDLVATGYLVNSVGRTHPSDPNSCIAADAVIKQRNARRHTPLHIAAINGNIVIIKRLITQGAFVDCEDANGNTALHLVAFSKNNTLETARYLIENGATVNKSNKRGQSPLHCAVESKILDLVEVLLEFGACINVRNNKGTTPLHISARKGPVELVELLIREGAAVNATDITGKTPLHHSVSVENINVTEYLINSKACTNKGDLHNTTPLHLAVERKFLNMVQLLVKHGAAVNSITVHGRTPLHIAAEVGHEDIMEVLLRAGSCVNREDRHGCTAFHLAVQHPQQLEYLLQQGADINHTNIHGCTTLHLAAFHGSLAAVQWLVGKGLSLHHKCNNGMTPLHFAINGCNYNVINWILKQDIGMNLSQGYISQLLPYAVLRDEPELVKKLVHQGGNIKMRFSEGISVLHKAALMGHLRVLEALMNLGVNMNQRCDDGRIALHFAAQEGRLKAVQFLAQHGCSVRVRSNNGTTPVHLAARGGHVSVVQWLTAEGASLHDITNDGQTVIHFAAQGDQEEMIAWLKSRSVSIHEKSNDGRGVIHFLALADDFATIKWLVSREGMNLFEKTTDGATVMHFALQSKFVNPSHLHWLRNKGFSLFDECNDGKMFLHHAALGNSSILWSLELLGTYFIDWETPCNDGRTPVHFAAQGGAMQCLQMLKSKGCNLSCKANDGRTAAHFAALGGSQETLQWLMQHGCDLYQLTDDNRTVAHFAAEGGHLSMLKWLTIRQHVNVHQTSNEGISVLHMAAKGGCVHALRWLIKVGLDLSARTSDGRSVLHFAAQGGSLRVVQWLVKQGVDVYSGTSIVDCATSCENIRVTDWLLAYQSSSIRE